MATAASTLAACIQNQQGASGVMLPLLVESAANPNKSLRLHAITAVLNIIRVSQVEELVPRIELIQEAVKLGTVDRDGYDAASLH